MSLPKDLEALKAKLAIPNDPGEPVDGCGDSSCVVKTPNGQRTNGGCRCEERALRRGVRYWRAKARFLQWKLDEFEKQKRDILK
jgi:hypothetical protein